MTTRETLSGPIVVGVDNSPEARAAAAYAAELAAGTPARTLLLAHAYRAPTGYLDVAGRGMIGELERAAKSWSTSWRRAAPDVLGHNRDRPGRRKAGAVPQQSRH